MEYNKLVRDYLIKFQEVAKSVSQEKSNELATRPCVHNFIENLIRSINDDVFVHHDQSFTRSEKPDWRLEDKHNFGVYCFGDHKKTNFHASPLLNDNEIVQIKRYIDLGRPVFVFDGLEFLFFKDSYDNCLKVNLVNKPIDLSSDWSELLISPVAENEFKKILNSPCFRQWSESELIEQVAVRARELSELLLNLLEAPSSSGIDDGENTLIESIHKLKLLISNHHDSSLSDDKACASFISQVLSFGLFYAHTKNRNINASPDEKEQLIKEFWNTSKYSEFAKQLSPFKAINDSLSNVLREKNVLTEWYTEMCNLLSHAEFMGLKSRTLDFHVLFERFLEKFDFQMKYDRGAFYTPQPLSFWLTNFTNEICKLHFGSEIFDLASKIIEPCMGTGSIIEELIKLNTNKNTSTNVIGLEILPAPFALSHYRLSEKIGSSLSEKNIHIFMTDTLSDDFSKELNDNEDLFTELRSEAYKVCENPIQLIIGNPPSSILNNPSSSRETINKLLDDFRPPKELINDRQNIQKALNNDALRFLRWSVDKVSDSQHSIVSMILPGSFTNSISFEYARKWLSKTFNYIYVLEIDADARANVKTDSLFDVKQGRMALICVNNNSEEFGLYYKNITKLSKEEKIEFLKNNYNEKFFEEIQITNEEHKFCVSKEYPKEEWSLFTNVYSTSPEKSIFRSKCSALKLAPSSLLFHTENPILIRRSKELGRATGEIQTQANIDKWYKGQSKPLKINKISHQVKKLLISITSNDIQPYTYRPFVVGSVINKDTLFEALENFPNSGTRSRPELRLAFSSPNIGIALSPSPKDLDSNLHRFVSFIWNLPDNDIVARGNAMIITAKYPENYKEGGSELSTNVNKKFESYLNEDEFIFYTYAVLSCDFYLNRYSGVLYSSFNETNPLRIPLTSDESLRGELVSLGRKIALCENFHDPKMDLLSHGTLSTNKIDQFNLSKVKIYNDYIELKSSDNKIVLVKNVNSKVLSLKISGHKVVEKWLRERTFSYLRRSLNIEDIYALMNLLGRIELQIKLIQETECIVRHMIESKKYIA